MVTVGFAVTLGPVVELNPVAGDQVYVVAPLAVSVVLPPLQTVPLVELTVGNGFTVTADVAVFTQPAALVPVTV